MTVPTMQDATAADLGGFDPTSLSDCIFAAAHPAQTLTDAFGVYEFSDLSDASDPFVQATTSKQPAVTTGVGGLVGFAGDDIDDILTQATGVNTAGALTIATLVEFTAATEKWVYASDSAALRGLAWGGSGIIFGTSSGVTTINDGTASSEDTPYRLIVIRGAGNALSAYVDGVDVTSGSPTNAGTVAYDSICGYYSSGIKFHPHIHARLAVYEADHTASLSDLDSWLEAGAP